MAQLSLLSRDFLTRWASSCMWGVQKQGLIALQSTPRRPAQHTEHHHLVSLSPPIITLLATEESTRQICHLALTVSTFGVNVGRTCGTNAPQAPTMVACSFPTSHAIARVRFQYSVTIPKTERPLELEDGMPRVRCPRQSNQRRGA